MAGTWAVNDNENDWISFRYRLMMSTRHDLNASTLPELTFQGKDSRAEDGQTEFSR